VERPKNFFPLNNRQVPVEKRHVRPKLPKLLDSLLPVPGLAKHGHVRLRIHHCGDPLAHPFVIVNHQDPDFLSLEWHVRLWVKILQTYMTQLSCTPLTLSGYWEHQAE